MMSVSSTDMAAPREAPTHSLTLFSAGASLAGAAGRCQQAPPGQGSARRRLDHVAETELGQHGPREAFEVHGPVEGDEHAGVVAGQGGLGDDLVDLPGQLDRGQVSSQLERPLAGPSLAQLAEGARRVVVVFPDLTRPMPNRTVLPPLLGLLERSGIPDDAVTLLCATGTHRQATPGEMRELVGDVDEPQIWLSRNGPLLHRYAPRNAEYE